MPEQIPLRRVRTLRGITLIARQGSLILDGVGLTAAMTAHESAALVGGALAIGLRLAADGLDGLGS
ncbi:hypothetical protein GCM10009827_000720 [Dactylosporangium maewongense]|uniref:Uncharacterized protein n=1 Tax=Dactylosporangium maewongense TaxID=634393 RepID=A0ABN1ZHJ7_9ACTN